jgi:hypothetical protein
MLLDVEHSSESSSEWRVLSDSSAWKTQQSRTTASKKPSEKYPIQYKLALDVCLGCSAVLDTSPLPSLSRDELWWSNFYSVADQGLSNQQT